MPQAIVTKYHPPTNTRGARMSATATAGRIFRPYAYEFDAAENHRLAAMELCATFRWEGTWAHGTTRDGRDGTTTWVPVLSWNTMTVGVKR